MFGYLRPLIPELKVSEYHRYRANYCGLCRAVSVRCGQASRLTLTYDVALLALLLSDLAGEPEEIRDRRCAARPLRPHKVREPGEAMRYCADMGLLLSHRRALDGWRDERRPAAAAAAAGLAAPVRAAVRRLGEAAGRVDAHLAALGELERLKCPDMDEPAERFGRLMETAAVSCPGLPGKVSEPLSWMARQIGRWLYMVDALDDVARDEARGCYNPLLLAARGRREAIRLTAEACRWAAGQAAAALDLLPLTYGRAVWNNVAYAGMPDRLDTVTKEGTPTDG